MVIFSAAARLTLTLLLAAQLALVDFDLACKNILRVALQF